MTGHQASTVLAKDGYDLGYSSPLTPHVCVLAQACLSSAEAPMLLTPDSRFSMSGPTPSPERREIVPIDAEREDSHTENASYRCGEKRSAEVQKVVIGFQEVVFS